MVPLSARDKKIRDQQVSPFLPNELIDCHAHIGLMSFFGKMTPERRAESIIFSATSLPVEDLMMSYESLFPEKKIRCVCFPFPFREVDLLEANRYVTEAARMHDNVVGFAAPAPNWTEEEIDSLVVDGGFKGLKPYPDLVKGKKGDDVSIRDFLTDPMLKVADRHAISITLHVPKSERLASSENLREIRRIATAYPSLSVILAHIGRLYCPQHVTKGISGVADLQNVYFDTSAVTDADVYTETIRGIGVHRILFGTDAPYGMLKARTICPDGSRIWIAKGEYEWLKPDVKRSHSQEIKKLTFMAYESILALEEAALRTELDKSDLKDIFYRNARRVIGI